MLWKFLAIILTLKIFPSCSEFSDIRVGRDPLFSSISLPPVAELYLFMGGRKGEREHVHTQVLPSAGSLPEMPAMSQAGSGLGVKLAAGNSIQGCYH